MKTLKTNQTYFLGYALLLLVAGLFQILYRQGIIILWINKYYSAFADAFFKYVTHLGDGRFCVAVGLLFLFWARKKGILILSSYALSGLLCQLLKRTFEEPRPMAYFERMMTHIHTVEGVELLSAHSFPSGHTASAFALYTFLALWTKNQYIKILWLLPALVVGYSRMYLFEHFLIDVFVGSIIGVASTLLINRNVYSTSNTNPLR